MKTKEQILLREIRKSKQLISNYKVLITNEERRLNEARASLMRLNEEERKKNAGKDACSPTGERRTTPSSSKPPLHRGELRESIHELTRIKTNYTN